MAENGCSQGAIIFGPNVVCSSVGHHVWLYKCPVQPFREPLTASEQGNFEAPFFPVIKMYVEFEVAGPRIIIYISVVGQKDFVVRIKCGRRGGCRCLSHTCPALAPVLVEVPSG